MAIEYDVPLIAQPTEYSCWAASCAMVMGWAEQRTVPIEEVCAKTGLSKEGGPHAAISISAALLVSTPLFTLDAAKACSTESGWLKLLMSNGPLFVWVQNSPTMLHAVVISGASDSSVTIQNPLPVGKGTKGTATAGRLAELFELTADEAVYQAMWYRGQKS